MKPLIAFAFTVSLLAQTKAFVTSGTSWSAATNGAPITVECIGGGGGGSGGGTATYLAAGVTVKAGQVIGYVGKMKTVAQSMLHREMYAGTAQEPLTDRQNPPFMRRADLQAPTAFLDPCQDETTPATA